MNKREIPFNKWRTSYAFIGITSSNNQSKNHAWIQDKWTDTHQGPVELNVVVPLAEAGKFKSVNAVKALFTCTIKPPLYFSLTIEPFFLLEATSATSNQPLVLLNISLGRNQSQKKYFIPFSFIEGADARCCSRSLGTSNNSPADIPAKQPSDFPRFTFNEGLICNVIVCYFVTHEISKN